MNKIDTLKKAISNTLNREVTEDNFYCSIIPEIIKLNLTFTNGKVLSIFLNEILSWDKNFAVYKESEHYYIQYDSNLVKYENLKTEEIENFIIEKVDCLNKGQVSIEELIDYYDSIEYSNVFDDTDAFQFKFGLKEKHNKPGFLNDEQMTMKIGHLKEELAEIEKAYQERDIAEVADGLMDLIYVASGLANLMNLPCDILWKDVQNSNMAYKERVTSLDNATKRGSTFDVRKTKNWIAPRGREIIKQFESWKERLSLK